MPYSNTQNEFIQNLHTVQNSDTRNSSDLNLFSENNFHSQSVTENNNFVPPVTLLYQPIYSNANMTGLGLGLLPSHSDPRGLPVPVGPGSSVMWSTTTTTHPVHHESTSSCAVGQGQTRSVNPATDFDVRLSRSTAVDVQPLQSVIYCASWTSASGFDVPDFRFGYYCTTSTCDVELFVQL